MGTIYVCINDIVNKWNQPDLNRLKKPKNRKELCRTLLPDAFTHNKDYNYIFDKENGLNESVLRMMVNGNRKSRSSNIHYLGNVRFCDDLIELMNNNLNERQSLYNKILKLCRKTEFHYDHPLFHDILLKPDYPYGNGYKAYEQLEHLFSSILSINTKQAYAFCIMILILAGWLQWRIEELSWLYEKDCINQFVQETKEVDHRPLIPFDDPMYMNTYYVYMYRTTRNDLFDLGTLELSHDYLYKNKAILTLEYTSGRNNTFLKAIYKGHFEYSKIDECLYCTMHREDGKIIQMVFYYDHFVTDMYYRQGLVINKAQKMPTPVAQKVILTKNKVKDEDLPYIKGLLNTSSKLIIMTPPMLTLFNEVFKDYEWFDIYVKKMYSFICDHMKESHILNVDMIYNYFITLIDKFTLIRIILALRSIDICGFEGDNHFMSFIHDSFVHEIFK